MSTETMNFYNSQAIPPHEGRFQPQSQAGLQKKRGKSKETRTTLRKRQSEASCFKSNEDQQKVVSQFAYSGYGVSDTGNSGEALGFVSDDLKQLLSKSDSGRNRQDQSGQQQHVVSPPPTSPHGQGQYQASPLPPQQGLYGGIIVPPPFLMNQIPQPGPHPYPNVAPGPAMMPLFMPMGAVRPMNAPNMYSPQQMHQLGPHPVALPPMQAFPSQVQPQSQSKTSNVIPTQAQLELAVQELRTNPQLSTTETACIALDKDHAKATGVTLFSKSSNDTLPKKQHQQQQTSSTSKLTGKSKQLKKKNGKKSDGIPPQQVSVTFSSSSPSSSSSRSSRNSNKKSNHGKSDSKYDSKSNGHSKCYAGATFATDVPQVTTLPKPSFV